jgi:hypothetical protein
MTLVPRDSIRRVIVGLLAICLVPIPFALLICLLLQHEKGESGPAWSDDSRAFRRSSSCWKHFDDSYRRKLQPSWSLTIVQLARAYLNGEECGFALHDALLETGRPEVADVFRTPDHPRRFWVAEEIVQQSDG